MFFDILKTKKLEDYLVRPYIEGGVAVVLDEPLVKLGYLAVVAVAPEHVVVAEFNVSTAHDG